MVLKQDPLAYQNALQSQQQKLQMLQFQQNLIKYQEEMQKPIILEKIVQLTQLL